MAAARKPESTLPRRSAVAVASRSVLCRSTRLPALLWVSASSWARKSDVP